MIKGFVDCVKDTGLCPEACKEPLKGVELREDQCDSTAENGFGESKSGSRRVMERWLQKLRKMMMD